MEDERTQQIKETKMEDCWGGCGEKVESPLHFCRKCKLKNERIAVAKASDPASRMHRGKNFKSI